MHGLLDNPAFRADYERLRLVRLNPARHAAATAFEHCEMVAARAAHLAALNGLTPEETLVLQNLAVAHDIGKIAGTANPDESVELVPRCGMTDAGLVALVKYHDINLPWYLASEKGQPPSDKAWRKMAGKVDLRLLCLFMVADRVDCPGGWRCNRPLAWFLQQVRDRNLLQQELHLDDGPLVSQAAGAGVEVSSGAALVRGNAPGVEVLVVKVRSAGYELPKGHLEWDERPKQAAARELREETGLTSEVSVGAPLGTLEYAFEQDGTTVQKRVHYFRCTQPSGGTPNFGPKPARTKEIRWIKEAEVPGLPLVSEDLRPILQGCFRRQQANESAGPAHGPDR